MGGFVLLGGSYSGVFCFESFTLSEIEDKLPNVVDKLPIDGIERYLEKEEGLPEDTMSSGH